MTDFPAAHSMDTEWFAVDACGHVAHFETGEAGAVPEGAQRGEDLLESWSAVAPPGDVVHDPDVAGGAHARPYGPMRVFVDSPDVVLAALRVGRARLERATRGVVVILRELDAETYAALHASGACRGCAEVEDDPLWGVPDLFGPQPARLGVFDYGHDAFENWIAGPYGLVLRPAHPIKLAQLPAEARAIVEHVRLPGCFARTPWLQPADLLAVQVHGGGTVYVASDGRTLRAQSGAGELDEYVAGRDFGGLVIDRSPWRPLATLPVYVGRSP